SAVWFHALTVPIAPALRRGRRGGRRSACRAPSHGETDVQDVAVLHDVLLSLHAQLSLVAGLRLAPRRHQVAVVDHLRPHEPTLEVGVDPSPGAGLPVATPDGPGLHLILA